MTTITAILMTVFIYALCCPLSGEIRYVGKTISDPGHRLSQHLNHPKNDHKGNWLAKLQKDGLRPSIEVLDTIENSNDEDWQEVERFWIAYLRFLGCRLTNLENGGVGGKRLSPQTIEKIIAKNRLRKATPEFRLKMKTCRPGFKMPPEAVARIAAKNRGRKMPPVSPETRAKMSAAKMGKKQPPRSAEHRLKISLARMGKKTGKQGPRSPQACANIRDGIARSRAKRGLPTQLFFNL